MKTKNSKKQHFLTYVLWEHILKWKRQEIMAGHGNRNEHVKPYAFGTSRKFIFNKAKKGDVLWIFTIPKFSEYSSLPSLIAKLIIEKVVDREKDTDKETLDKIPKYIRDRWEAGNRKKSWQYVVLGKEKAEENQSSYFPMNSAFFQIKSAVKPENRKKVTGENGKKNNSYLSNYFRTIRKIANRPGNSLLNFVNNLEKQKIVFISYRRGKGSKLVHKLVEQLMREKMNCWLDINRIPQEKDKKIEFETFFRNELKSTLDECKTFVALKRSDYFESYWTKLEFNLATDESKRRKEKGTKLTILEYDLKKLANDKEMNNIKKEIIGS